MSKINLHTAHLEPVTDQLHSRQAVDSPVSQVDNSAAFKISGRQFS